MIDNDGFRYNVGIILANESGKLFWGRRIGQDAWQFPQGGMRRNETHEQAMYRELDEEIGLQPEHVEVLGVATIASRYVWGSAKSGIYCAWSAVRTIFGWIPAISRSLMAGAGYITGIL